MKIYIRSFQNSKVTRTHCTVLFKEWICQYLLAVMLPQMSNKRIMLLLSMVDHNICNAMLFTTTPP